MMNNEIKKDINPDIQYYVQNPQDLKISLNTFIKEHGIIKDKDKDVLLDFWFAFMMNKLQENLNSDKFNENEKDSSENFVDQNSINKKNKNVSKSAFTKHFKGQVYQLLEEKKSSELSSDDLRQLQLDIESLTMEFNEEDIFSSSSSLIKEMTSGNQISAKEYLKCKYKFDKKADDMIRIKVVTSKDKIHEEGAKLNDVLTPNEKRLLDQFSHHTLEALLIHIMSTLFGGIDSSVKVATLVDRIEKAVRDNAAIFASIHSDSEFLELKKAENDRKEHVLRYPFGTALVEFLVEREMIQIVFKESDSASKKIRKKNQSFYLEKSVYAECSFHPCTLPVQMNLPMISPPMDWQYKIPAGKEYLEMSDLYGGYLKGQSSEIYSPYRLLSSSNFHNFHICFGKNNDSQTHQNAEDLCKIMNKLQKQPYRINDEFLNALHSDVKGFVQCGLLMPSYLSYLTMNVDLTTILRECYLNNPEVQEICTYNQLLEVLQKNVQRARFERLILNLANAYSGYHFYLPAYLDFRGRIYRSGILHFHERDLARSLILIVDSNCSLKYSADIFYKQLFTSAAFHYKKYPSYYVASKEFPQFYDTAIKRIPLLTTLSVSDVYKFIVAEGGVEAKNPFQFLSLLWGYFRDREKRSQKLFTADMNEYPITQDASASAYQIMSYFMLDERMARRTNLIQSDSDNEEIQDIYSFLRDELLSYFENKFEKVLYSSMKTFFTRKLVKSIFMPLIYGKTLMSTTQDIKAELSQYITNKECFDISRHCFQFWSTKYAHMDCLIRLIRIIGWFASTCDRGVEYHTPYFHTYQDYRVLVPYCIWVYDKKTHKRRKITLRVSSEKRDRKKTEVSTFVNFIHQKDAYIAMKVVDKMIEKGAPIYTVHDNFITNTSYCHYLPYIYLETIREMGPPLKIINEFLIKNLFYPVKDKVQNHAYEESDNPFNPNRVITPADIDNFLSLNMPENFEKEKKEKKRLSFNIVLLCIRKIRNRWEFSRRRPYKKVGEVQKSTERKVLHTLMMNKMNKKSNFTMIKSYSTIRDDILSSLSDLHGRIDQSSVQKPHPGLILASNIFRAPNPLICENILLSLSVMDLLIRYAYPSVIGYAKFTILLTMRREYGDNVTFTIGNAIPLTLEEGGFIPKIDILANINALIMKYSELYEGAAVSKIAIRVFAVGKTLDILALSIDEILSQFREFLRYFDESSTSIKHYSAKKIRNSNKKYAANHITSLKSNATMLQPFLVADTETLFINNVHMPYAAGVMMVHPRDNLATNSIYSYFSEDYSKYLYDSFEKRSEKLLTDLLIKIRLMIKQNPSIQTVYFHNFGRFDGIILLKHIALHHPNYTLKPLMRNNMLYELSIYEGDRKVFRFRDSMHLLPGSLDNLAKSLCPELGSKGSINYDSVTLENLGELKIKLLDYMKQDILLLAGVMQKAQRLYFEHYNVDIVSKITCSSLALTIFRMKYYDEENHYIHIPNKNADSFIRSGYYGGHTDAYKKYGENLYYYDVNSLYPFIMKEYSVPAGKPVWHAKLGDRDIDSLFGFIEAYVKCPNNLNKPFLPYRGKDGILIFPTGEFFGVYYSEELKYAKKLGYEVIPISGYLFEERESPFKGYVSSLYASRLQAKKEGNDAMSYVYKILMNSLYGRFGINPKSTKTEMCDSTRFNFLLKKESFIDAHMLRENLHMVWYHTNTDDDSWEPPQNTAVQISAAITANARIYMYPYISRDDCYYTDTDSIILGNPLPEDEISTSVLGKFKLEDNIQKGFFLAAKAYAYTPYDDANNVIKFKGPAKDYVNLDWFLDQYEKPDRSMRVTVTNKFSINWKKLEVFEKNTLFNLGIKQNTKRFNLREGNTAPFCLNDFSAANNYSIRVIKSLLKRCNLLEAEMNKYLLDRLNNKDKEMNEREKGKVTKEQSCKTKDGVIEKKEDLESINNTEIESSLTEESAKTDDLKPDT